MPTAASDSLHRARKLHPAAYWADVQKCPAIKLREDGTAEIDHTSPALLAFLKRWNPKNPKPAPPKNIAEQIQRMKEGMIPPPPAGTATHVVSVNIDSKERWGPRLWAEMYEFATAYGGDAETGSKWFADAAARVGCGQCRAEYVSDLAANPLDFAGRDTLFASISRLHNRVNARIGKPELTLDEARARWGMDEPSPPPVDYFGMSVVFSLKRTPERLAQFWHDWPVDWPFLPPMVFEAIDGEQEAAKPGWRGGAGAWGLMRTCIAALDQYLAMETEKPLLIFEDDCEWLAGAMPELRRFIARLPVDFDAAFPGAQHMGETVPMGKGIVRAFGAHRMHCIIIARKYAKALREGWEKFDFIQDHWLTAESPRRRFYAAEPFLCFQRANISNLAGHYVPDRGGQEWQGMASGVSRPSEPGRFERAYPLKCGGVKRFIDVGERNAFNGAAINTPRGRLLMSRGDSLGTIKYRWLDGDKRSHPTVPSVQLPLNSNDDPRLAWHDGRLYLSTNFWWGRWAGGQMELREVIIGDDRSIKLRDVGKFTTIGGWPGYAKPAHEKNWVPFSHSGKLLYIYSINPHRVLEVDLEKSPATVNLIHESAEKRLPWPITDGTELRCTAPPVLMANGVYLSTFHVRREKDYWTGFYTFDAHAFEILQMSREPVLWPEDSDGVCWRNGSMRLLFVQSMEIDGDKIRLTGGDNDHSVMEAEIPLAAVMESLQSIK